MYMYITKRIMFYSVEFPIDYNYLRHVDIDIDVDRVDPLGN